MRVPPWVNEQQSKQALWGRHLTCERNLLLIKTRTDVNPIVRHFLPSVVRGVYRADDEFAKIEDERVFKRFVEAKLRFLPPTVAEAFRRQLSLDDDFERTQQQQMTAFKEDMKRNLAEHQQVSGRQLTDFLNKQNALVQNLSQQIDSFNRVSQAQSADLATTNGKVGELASALTAHKTTATNELAALAGGVNELKALLAEVQAGSHSQGESISALDTSLQETSTQLSQTIEKLRHLPLVGGKFK